MNLDIQQIADLITEDPNIFNKAVEDWDRKSVLNYQSHLKVLSILKEIAAKYGLDVDHKKIKAIPTPDGFSVKGIEFVEKREKKEEEPEEAQLLPPVPPPEGMPPMPGLEGMPGGAEMAPGGAIPPAPPGLGEDVQKQELIDKLARADNDESIAATFEDNFQVNAYRAISGEFAKRVRDELGLDVTHQYLAPPPGATPDKLAKPMYSISLPKVRTAIEEPEEIPPEAEITPAAPEEAPKPEPAPEETPSPKPENLVDVEGIRLPPDLAPDVMFPELEKEVAEGLESKLNIILN